METEEKDGNSLKVELKNELVSYMNETNIHGFKYISGGRSLFERFAWGIFLSIAFWFTFHEIMEANRHWDNHPVGTIMDEVGLPVHELPFPAISVTDSTSLTMPRKSRWMFVEALLSSLELVDPEGELKYMYPGNNKEIVLFKRSVLKCILKDVKYISFFTQSTFVQ